MIRLLTLVQKPFGIAPNQRFRVEQWAPHLATQHGIRLEFRPFESAELGDILYQPAHVQRKARLLVRDAWRRRLVVSEARDFDGVVVVREASMLGGAWVERALAARKCPLLFDFDDAIWRYAPGRNGIMALARAPWKVGQICRLAGAVTVGNRYLADYAGRFSRNVSIVRTSIEVDRFPAIPEPTDRPFTIVWTGSHSTLQHLESIRPALEEVGLSRELVIRVICDVAPARFKNAQLEFVPWSSAKEAQDLGASHVGIMPLPDTLDTRGKCGCKALQYMAIQRAVVVSPVGINREIVRNGFNGFWASTQEEWKGRLLQLASDAGMRSRIGAEGRNTVIGGFSARESAANFATAVRSIIRDPK